MDIFGFPHLRISFILYFISSICMPFSLFCAMKRNMRALYYEFFIIYIPFFVWVFMVTSGIREKSDSNVFEAIFVGAFVSLMSFFRRRCEFGISMILCLELLAPVMFVFFIYFAIPVLPT